MRSRYVQSATHCCSLVRVAELEALDSVALETSEASELVLSWARAKAARPKVATVVKKRILMDFGVH